ncbi:hypothetical protein CQW23_07417 [Capsicum baccatum]|uniref:Uncharacterized protein n=1 Tax=Capsicum baccatum TaxID=33114 RepID=A0A2G2X625_CAPBA|nr:hypothetical protein CQW23_07417 [Capsicum baccatum]
MTGMSTLLGHLLTSPKWPTSVDKKQSNLASKSISGGSQGDVVVMSWKFDQEECRKALCHVVIIYELPFSFVENEGGRLIDSFRSSLTPKLVQVQVCLQGCLRSEQLKQPVSVEEDLDNLDKIEKDLASAGKDPTVVDM